MNNCTNTSTNDPKIHEDFKTNDANELWIASIEIAWAAIVTLGERTMRFANYDFSLASFR